MAVVFINLIVVNKSTKSGYLKPEIKRVLAQSSGGSGSSSSGVSCMWTSAGSDNIYQSEGNDCVIIHCDVQVCVNNGVVDDLKFVSCYETSRIHNCLGCQC